MVSSKHLPECPQCRSQNVDVELDYFGPGESGFSCTCNQCGHEWERHFSDGEGQKHVPLVNLFQHHQRSDLTDVIQEYLKQAKIPNWNCRDHAYHWFRGEIRGENALFNLYIGVNDLYRFIHIGVEFPFSISNNKLSLVSEFCMRICQFPFVKLEIDYTDQILRASVTHDATDGNPSFETFIQLLGRPLFIADRLYPSITHLMFAHTSLMDAMEEAKQALQAED